MSANEIVFRISGKRYQRLLEWERAVDERVFKQELETGRSPRGVELSPDTLEIMRLAVKRGKALPPWYGVSQGAYVYEFVPTTAGLIIKVKNTETGDSIDLTDYSEF